MVVFFILLSSACLLAVGIYLYLMWKYRRVREAVSKLPCPIPLPIVGNVFDFLGDISNLNKKINEMATDFKGLFTVWLGPIPLIVVSNPVDLKIILNSSNMLSKDTSYQFGKPYMGHGLLTAPVPKWKKYRRLLNPVMHPSNIELCITDLNAVSRGVISDLEKKSGTGKIDSKDIIYSNVVDAALETMFGGATLSDAFKENLLFLMAWGGCASTNRAVNPLYYFDAVFNLFNYHKEKEARRCVSAITTEFNQVIESFKKKKESGTIDDLKAATSILDIMYETGSLHDSHWIDEIITFSIGATDTVVSAIYFLLASLAINQEVQDKVYSEVKDVLGSCEGDLTLRDLNSLTYLGHAITESMRLHGVFPIIGRVATKDTKLSQCTLPAGTRVIISLHAMGRYPEVFSEPLRFNPDRFMSEDNQNGSTLMNNILIFSAGPRNCIGKAYALLLIKIFTARIISKYKLVTEMKMEDIEYEFKVVMFAKKPLMIEFQPR